jgi:hypothetical protein
MDPLTKSKFNTAYIAHIVADKPNGPRGHEKDSEVLKSSYSNLMLMCDVHHRLIDREDVTGHPVELLMKMKEDHENRISIQSELTNDKQSHVLLYGAKVGHHSSPLTWQKSYEAISPKKFPADINPIKIGLDNSATRDDEEHYWSLEKINLEKNFQRLVKSQLSDGHIKHLSVFAIAPQPLLIELGRLISDFVPSDVYQLKREPSTWSWVDGKDVAFLITEAKDKRVNVALNISLSGNISDERITDVLGEDTSIWTLTINDPHNDFLKTPKTLESFRQTVRKLYNEIKRVHGQNTILNVFPAMPVSAAVEFGRVWQPKADMEMIIYDQNRNRDGFIKTIEIQNTERE